MSLDQQIHTINSSRFTNRLETHKLVSDNLVKQIQNNHESILVYMVEKFESSNIAKSHSTTLAMSTKLDCM
jgi:hypothetical protein